MDLWRLSATAFAQAFDGGYGLNYAGRWNSRGHALTYCATSPSLCILEKLVHIEDPTLMPTQVMIRYRVPDQVSATRLDPSHLPDDWRERQDLTQSLGDAWHRERQTALLQVPSAILPLAESPDLNVVINHTHPDAERIRIAEMTPFDLDARLLRTGG